MRGGPAPCFFTRRIHRSCTLPRYIAGMIHTKIIATVGPASSSTPILKGLIEAGVDVFRLNFSHGTRETHQQAVASIRAAAAQARAIVAIMGDLAGPKIRLGVIPGGPRDLSPGGVLKITRDPNPRDADSVGTNYPALIDEAGPGDRLLIDDGNVMLRVRERTRDALICICEEGGTISDRKGINLPDTHLSLPALTPKDEADAAWAVSIGLDYLALSFVRSADDLRALSKRLPSDGGPLIVAKIEKPEAVDAIGEIIEACDVVLVARGDMGVEMDVSRVPLIQKQIVRQCRYAGRPVIIATQMLQSMTDSPLPTRAEVSDAANAILDNADVLMLSAETAVGKYPVEAVRMLHRIAEQTEPLLHRWGRQANVDVLAASMRVTSAVARGAALLARDLSAKLVAVYTKRGRTPSLLSKQRLSMPVIGVANDEAVCRRMAMYFGVMPLLLAEDAESSAMLARLDAALLEKGMAELGDVAIVVAGTVRTQPGSANSLVIHEIGTAM